MHQYCSIYIYIESEFKCIVVFFLFSRCQFDQQCAHECDIAILRNKISPGASSAPVEFTLIAGFISTHSTHSNYSFFFINDDHNAMKYETPSLKQLLNIETIHDLYLLKNISFFGGRIIIFSCPRNLLIEWQQITGHLLWLMQSEKIYVVIPYCFVRNI